LGQLVRAGGPHPRGPMAPLRVAMSEARMTGLVASEDSRPGLVLRSLSHMTVGGVRHSMLTLLSTAVGGGVLSVSYVMRLCGLGLGVAMLVAGALLSYISTRALMRMSAETGHGTYAGLFSACAGPRAGPVLDAMIFIYGNGVCIGYFVFLGDFIPSLVSLAHDAPSWCASREAAIGLAAILVLPLVLLRDVAKLRYASPISIIALVYVAAVIAAEMPYQAHRNSTKYSSVEVVRLDFHAFEAFAICVFAFNCHMNVVPVAGSLVRPTKARIFKVSARVNMLQLAFYSLIGVSGYLSFHQATEQDVTRNYPAGDVFVAIGRAVLTCSTLVAIPMNFHPTLRSGLQIRDYLSQGVPLLAPSPTASPRSASTSTPSASAPSPQSGSQDQGVSEPAPPTSAEHVRIALTLVCVVVQVIAAILVPGVADVLSILGATVATAIMLFIPGYAIGVLMPPTALNRTKQAFLYIFSLVSVMSVPIKILIWAKVIG